jgi:hypothetical protein
MRLAAIALVLCACCCFFVAGCAHSSKTSDATSAPEASAKECNPSNCAMSKEECEKMKTECTAGKKACCAGKAPAAEKTAP